jgi:hypothetical protein
MRASELVAAQAEEIASLKSYCAVLKGALTTAGLEVPSPPPWTFLTEQEGALLGLLKAAYPGALSKVAIEELLPSRDWVRERALTIVPVLVHKVRRKLGEDIIETRRDRGYRLSDAAVRSWSEASCPPASS